MHPLRQAIAIADEIGYPTVQCSARWGLAQTHLYTNDLPAARAAVEAARQYDVPENNHNVAALLGLVALRQGQVAPARVAFREAIALAEALLAKTPEFYDALYAKGLAWSGLAVGGALALPLTPSLWEGEHSASPPGGLRGERRRLAHHPRPRRLPGRVGDQRGGRNCGPRAAAVRGAGGGGYGRGAGPRRGGVEVGGETRLLETVEKVATDRQQRMEKGTNFARPFAPFASAVFQRPDRLGGRFFGGAKMTYNDSNY